MQVQVEKFLDHLSRRGLSPHTLKAYRSDLGQFASLQGVVDVRNAHASAIRAFLAQAMARGVSRRSLARKLSALKAFFKYLVACGELGSNPAETLRTPRFGRNLPAFLDLTRAKEMVEAPRGANCALSARDAALLELLYSSGMRVSELTGIDAGDIDGNAGMLRVCGKGSKERLVPVGSYAAAALGEYLRVRRACPGEMGLFVNRFGTRLSGRSIQRLVEKYAVRIGLGGKVSPHTLRHTFATHMLDNGCDLRVLQEMLGHSSLATTQIYTHVTTRRMQEVYRKTHPRAR
jgi:integrase/recombinase XerC